MPINNESREKLIECAKKDFIEKGFTNASLRSICSQAGLTTGAVYFLFKDKNGLLEAVVSDALNELMALLHTHIEQENKGDISDFSYVAGGHDSFAKQLVDLLYSHYDEMMILLEKSQGSQFENITDRMVEMLDEE